MLEASIIFKIKSTCPFSKNSFDTFSSLEGLCEDMDVSEKEICEKLNAIGCTYIREINQFR